MKIRPEQMLQQLHAAQIRQLITEKLAKRGKTNLHEILFLRDTISESVTGELEQKILHQRPRGLGSDPQIVGEHFVTLAKRELYEAAQHAAAHAAPDQGRDDHLNSKYEYQLQRFSEMIGWAGEEFAKDETKNGQRVAELKDIQKCGLEFLVAFRDIIIFGRGIDHNKKAVARNRITQYFEDETAEQRRRLYQNLFREAYLGDGPCRTYPAPGERGLFTPGAARAYLDAITGMTNDDDKDFVIEMLISFLN